MHDRALIFFTDGENVSAPIFLLHGGHVPSLLAVTAGRIARDNEPAAIAHAMALIGKPEYCATRFLGVYVNLVGETSVECLLADREFVGVRWLGFLTENNVP